jgi:hypothetical protein
MSDPDDPGASMSLLLWDLLSLPINFDRSLKNKIVIRHKRH